MSYPAKYREQTIEYREAGHTPEETHMTVKAAIAAVRKWDKQLREEGHSEKNRCIAVTKRLIRKD